MFIQMKRIILGLIAGLFLVGVVCAREPQGEPVKCLVTRDTRFSAYPGEENLAFGGAGQGA